MLDNIVGIQENKYGRNCCMLDEEKGSKGVKQVDKIEIVENG